jgi:putative IMPACT (imprinted ancient) family translation regulator
MDRPGLFTLDDVIRDRGSRYAVSGGPAADRAAARAQVAALCREKRFAKATHKSWALLSRTEGPIKADDGEAGAGAVILRMLEREALYDTAVIVTRWFGGTHLGGDRFAHVAACTRAWLDAHRARG